MYDDLSHTAQGLGKALLLYVDKHHEASAFGLHSDRLLHTFFVDVSLRGTVTLSGKLMRDTDRDSILASAYAEIVAYQKALPAPASGNPIFEVLPEQTSQKEPLTLFFKDNHIEKVSTEVAQALQSTSLTKIQALHLLTSWSAFLAYLLPLLPKKIRCKSLAHEQVKSYHIQDLDPTPMVQYKEALCITGEAGAGKTSLARALIRAGIELDRQCTYFPCYAHRIEGHTLQESICDFLQSLAEDTSSVAARRHLLKSSIIVIDGCDEAYNFSRGFDADLLRLHQELFAERTVSIVVDELYTAFRIPSDLTSVLRIESINKKSDKHPRTRLTCVPPLRSIDFDRLVENNKENKDAFESLRDMYKEKSCQIVVTTRESTSLGLSDTWHHLSLTPFSDKQLDIFFARWFSNDQRAFNEIVSFLKEHQHIRDVCRRPIVASLLAAMRQNGCDLPHSRTELYGQRFNLLLEGRFRV